MGGVGIRAGGLEKVSKIDKRGGDDYSVLESMRFETLNFSLNVLVKIGSFLRVATVCFSICYHFQCVNCKTL